MAAEKIPLSTGAQAFAVDLGGTAYRMRLTWRDAEEGGWVLDIDTETAEPVARGIPLVTGADLLGQYRHLGIPGGLYVITAGDPDAPPTFASLGVTSHLYFLPHE